MLERVTVVRRALPAIPLTTTTTTTTPVNPEQQQRQQEESSAWFDSGHYTDIHFNVGGAAARIPTWRRSIVDDPDHYSYPELLGARPQQSRRSGRGGYEALGTASQQAAAAGPAAARPYTGITATLSTDQHGYILSLPITE